MKRLSLAAFSMILASAAAAGAAEPVGEWLVEGGYGQIRIERCGEQLWGIVSWEKKAGIDRNNPDASKRERPTLGLPILRAMSPTGPNRWEGEIYNTEDGRVYSSNISLASDDVLRVQGCVLGFLCGGQDWTRVKAAAMPAAPGTGKPAPRTSRNAAPADANAPKNLSAIPAKEVCAMATGLGGSTYSGDGGHNTGAARPRR
jgi:uncharacterized protein (DUF2147 family)